MLRRVLLFLWNKLGFSLSLSMNVAKVIIARKCAIFFLSFYYFYLLGALFRSNFWCIKIRQRKALILNVFYFKCNINLILVKYRFTLVYNSACNVCMYMFIVLLSNKRAHNRRVINKLCSWCSGCWYSSKYPIMFNAINLSTTKVTEHRMIWY